MKEISIHLESISKKFHQFYLFQNINLDIYFKDKLVITGNNGSGKSTLLKIIIGLISPTSGQVIYKTGEKILDKKNIYQNISAATPYMSLPEDFSITELIKHLYIYRNYYVNPQELLNLLDLDKHLHKPIKQFSSGMKQKTKLLLAIADTAPVLLLDEPLSNLDAHAVQWYKNMINKFTPDKTVIVFSNAQHQEYFFCDKNLSLSSF